MKPKYQNVLQMEDDAKGQADYTVCLRLRSAGKVRGLSVWLRVVWYSTGCRFYHDIGRKNIELTREQAQQLIDAEWGR